MDIRAEDVPAARRVAAFAFLMSTDFFYGWAWNTADVLRPDIRAALRLSLGQAGSMYSAQGAGALVGAIVIGQLADRLGRRNALFGIMVGYGLALGWGAAVGSYPELMAQRFVLGLFMGGVFPTVVALYTSLFDRRVCGKLAGFYNGTFNGSVVVLGVLANRLHIGDWHTLVLLGAIPPLVLAPFAYVIVPETEQKLRYVELKQIVRNGMEYGFLPGQSLWRDRVGGPKAIACMRADAPSCTNFLAARPKATAQDRLERSLAAFEARPH